MSESDIKEVNVKGLTIFCEKRIEAWTLMRLSDENYSLSRRWPGYEEEEASVEIISSREVLEHKPILEMFGEDRVKEFIDSNETTI